jgi:CHAD domain-containing protein
MSYVTAATPLWIAARALLARRGVELFLQWSKARQSLDLQEIHDLRVATRRVREGFALFRPCFSEKRFRQPRLQIRAVTRVLSGIRNADEALLFFTSLVELLPSSDFEGMHSLIARLQSERRIEERRLKRYLRSQRSRVLSVLYKEACNTPSLFTRTGVDPFQPLNRFARTALEERWSAVIALVSDACREEEQVAQHRLRIAVKRLRYRLEILAPAARRSPDDLLTTLKLYQERLGTIHDLDVFRELGDVYERGTAIPLGSLYDIIAARRATAFTAFLELLAARPPEELRVELTELV